MRKKLAIGVAATVAVAMWVGARARASEPGDAGPPASTTAAAGSGDAAPVQVSRLDGHARAALLDLIRTARAQRVAEPAPAPKSLKDFDEDDRIYLRAAVREIRPLVHDCYEDAVARDPDLEGTLVVDFTIEGEPGAGSVITTTEIDGERSTIADPELRECMEQTMYALRFDPPPASGTVTVAYPFTFHQIPSPRHRVR
jgi:hypothetical protein